MSDIERKVSELEDIGAIKRLKAEYCVLADIWKDSENRAARFADLFTDDGEWILEGKHCKGKAEIVDTFTNSPLTEQVDFAMHYAVNPRIDVDGDSATGTWHFMLPLRFRGTSGLQWIIGMYFEEYRRTGQGWKFSKVSAEIASAPG